VIQANGATGTTIAPGDVVNGGSGDDTLSISVAGLLLTNDYTLSAVQTTGVEKVLVNNFDTDATLNNIVDTALMSGLTTVGLSASAATGDTAFSNMTAIVAAEMRNGSGDLTLTYGTAAVAGTADTQNLTLSAQTGGTFTAANVETLAVTSDLSANTLAAITATSMTKLTVAGSANLKVTGALATKTIDASAATGVVNVTLTTADQSVTGGSGADIIDTVTMLTSADTINGGSGVDTLKMSVGNATVAVGTSAAKLALFNVSNVEVIDVASTLDTAVLNLDNTVGVTTLVAAANLRSVVVTGDTANTAAEVVKYTLNGVARETASVSFTGTDAATEATLVGAAIALAINSIAGAPFVAVNAAGTVSVTAVTGEAVELAITAGTANTSTYGAQSAYGAVSFTNMAAGQVLDVYSAGAVTAELKDASGTTDAMSVNFKTTSGDKGFDHGVGAVTLNNIETINVTTAGMTATKTTTVSTLSGSAVKELTLAGDSNLTISAFTGVTTLVTIDGSSATGDLNLAAAGAAKDQSIKTGLGNDTINMAAFLTAADTIDAGGNTIIAATGLMGKDTLTADVTSVIGTAGLLKIANVETLNLTNTGTATLDLANVTGASVIAVTGAAATTTLNKLAAAATVSLGFADESGAAVTGTTTLALADATGTADVLTLNLAEVTSNTLKTTGIETVNLAFNNTAAIGVATTTITSTGLTASKLVVTGAAADTGTVLALGTVNAATATVDASAYSGVLTMTANDLTNTTVSIKTGNINNAIVGGAGNDTVTIGTLVGDDANGGAGTDILNATIKASLTEATTNFETINYTIDKNVQVTVTAANGAGVDTATSFNLLGGDALTTLAMNFDSPAALTTINMAGYTGKSTSLSFAASQLAATLLQTITGGAGNDTITATTANDNAGVAAMTGIENLVLNVAGGASTFDFSKTTGLVKVSVDDDNTARSITLSKIADTTAVVVTTGITGTTVVIDSATKSAVDNSIKVTVGTTVDTVNLSISNIETLNLANTVGASTVDLSLVAMTAAGGTSKMIVTGDQVLTIAATNAAITTIDASGMGVGGTVVQTGRSGNAASVYTGADGADTFIMKHADDVINGGAGTDTLTVIANLVLGGIQVNLNATGDQVTTFNGSANAAVQSSFENVNLTGITGNFGTDVTAKSTGSTITGTTNADVITLGAAVDTVVINDSTIDSISTFTKTATGDVLSFSLATLEAAGGSGINASASNFTKLNSAANGADAVVGVSTVQELTLNGAASAVDAGNVNVFVMIGNTAANTDAVETNLEAGGDVALTIHAGDDVAGQSFFVVYSDGTDAYLASVRVNAATTADTDFEATNLTAVNVAKLVGITSIATGDFATANFNWIA
jgi:S-layer protein